MMIFMVILAGFLFLATGRIIFLNRRVHELELLCWRLETELDTKSFADNEEIWKEN